MRIFTKKKLILLAAVFILTAPFFSNFAQASFWDIIRAWVTINPLEVKVSVPVKAEIGKVFKIETRAINKGEEEIKNAEGKIFLPPELTLIQKDPVKKMGIISNKREKKVSWLAKGETTGNYVISILVSGELRGEIITADDSTMIKVEESLPRGKTRRLFQNFFDFFQKLF